MDARDGRSLAAIVLLVVFVGWQLSAYAAHADARTAYPTASELEGNFEGFHGQEVDVWVTVAARTDDGFRATNGWQVALDDRRTALDAGDSVQVYGIAEPGPRIDAERVTVVDARNRQYMLGSSLLGALLTLGAVIHHWRPSLDEGYLVARSNAGDTEGGDR